MKTVSWGIDSALPGSLDFTAIEQRITGMRADSMIIDDYTADLFSKNRKQLQPSYIMHQDITVEDGKVVRRIERLLADTKPGRHVNIPIKDALRFACLVGHKLGASPKARTKKLTPYLVAKWLGFANDAIAQQVARRLS